MTSGIAINPTVADECDKLVSEHAYRYVLLRLSDDLTEFVVDTCGARDATHDDFVALLPEDDPRIALYDFDAVSPGGCALSRFLFVVWNPENAPVRQKLICTVSALPLRRSLLMSSVHIEATNSAGISLKAVEATVIGRASS